ncbi:MAG: hypothetical protein AB7G11_03905, partial [Phycisphaerales bacterium]
QTDVTALFLAEQDLRAGRAKAIEVEQQMSISLIRLQRAVGGPGVAASVGESPATTEHNTPVSVSPLAITPINLHVSNH